MPKAHRVAATKQSKAREEQARLAADPNATSRSNTSSTLRLSQRLRSSQGQSNTVTDSRQHSFARSLKLPSSTDRQASQPAPRALPAQRLKPKINSNRKGPDPTEHDEEQLRAAWEKRRVENLMERAKAEETPDFEPWWAESFIEDPVKREQVYDESVAEIFRSLDSLARRTGATFAIWTVDDRREEEPNLIEEIRLAQQVTMEPPPHSPPPPVPPVEFNSHRSVAFEALNWMTAQRRVRPDPAQHPAWYESIGSFETPVEIFDFQFGTISKYCRLHELEGTTKDIREQLERKDEELTRGKSEVEELKRKLHIAEMQRNSVAERAIQDLSVARF